MNGTGTACRLQWRTAVVLPNDPSGDILQLVLPATSVFGKEDNGKFPFRAYVQMLASNNISAGRVVTRMQFDTKSPVPKLLFSPVDAVSSTDIEAVIEQSKSVAAENAIKLTVFQQDGGEEVAQPAVPGFSPHSDERSEVSEPTLRASGKAEETTEGGDMPDAVRRWSKKK